MMALAGKLSAVSLRNSVGVACEIAAFAALGASLAWLMWAMVEPVGPMPTSTQPIRSVDAAEHLATRLSRIPGVTVGQGGRVNVAQDAGGFVLYGARAGADGGGTAILSVNGAPQAAFSVGDEVAAGARLVRVGRDHVEIDASGRSLRVFFDGATPASPPAERAPVPAAGSDVANSLVNALSLQPVNRPGGGSGFKVMSEADLSALGLSGLRAGDVLLKVNGVDMSPANLAGQAALLQTGNSLEIVYERNGQISTTRIGRPAQ